VARTEAIEAEAALQAGDRVVVVANPATRRNIRRIIAELRKAAPDGVNIDVRITTRAGEARQLAGVHAPGARLLIAVGGDGTVADVASAAIDHGIPLGILPGGSTNIIAKELRVPSDPVDGAALIFGPHHLKRIDAGSGAGRIFLHMAGAGFDSRFFARSNPALKRKVGWVAYLPAAARTLFDRPTEVCVRVDGAEVRTTSPLVLVANGRSVLHTALKIASGISKSDGVFDVFIVTALSAPEKAKVLSSFIRHSLDQSPYVIRMRGSEVEIAADPPLPVQFDGDVAGTTPLTLRLLPGALRVIVPIVSGNR
jgi:YegS/Rv2252/BmrU family lipid kinase